MHIFCSEYTFVIVLGFCCNFSFYLDFVRLPLLQAAQKNEENTKTAPRSLVKAMLKLKIFTDTEQNVLRKVQIWNHRPSLFSCVHICLTAPEHVSDETVDGVLGNLPEYLAGLTHWGLSLRERVKSSVIWEGVRVEPLLVHIERSQLRWIRYLPGTISTTPAIWPPDKRKKLRPHEARLCPLSGIQGPLHQHKLRWWIPPQHRRVLYGTSAGVWHTPRICLPHTITWFSMFMLKQVTVTITFTGAPAEFVFLCLWHIISVNLHSSVKRVGVSGRPASPGILWWTPIELRGTDMWALNATLMDSVSDSLFESGTWVACWRPYCRSLAVLLMFLPQLLQFENVKL